MTTNENKKKKSSVTRKVVPAAGMLAISAAMLASSTYAWFTMSREVEVSNIQMSATVPEDIQISLGAISNPGNTAISDKEGTASLTNGLGMLWKGSGTSADNGAVQPPTNDWDWSNIADISEYYQFGKLIPASSTTGANIFFTAQASGNGQTLLANAEFYQANSASAMLTAGTQESLGITGATKDTSLAATVHAVTSKTGGAVSDKWSTAENGDSGVNYSGSIGWDNTQDDGYYIDIPVWLRTSSSGGAKLSVQGYVKPKNVDTVNGATSNNALYRAVRVAIIDVGDGTAVNNPGAGVAPYTYDDSANTVATKNLIPLADGWDIKNGETAGKLKENPFAFGTGDANVINNSILNWYGRNYEDGSSTGELKATTAQTGDTTKAAVISVTNKAATYGTVTVYDPVKGSQTGTDPNIICVLDGADITTGQKNAYGTPHKIVVRVWLEGEDPDCWNETAGQDWSINLKFNNETTAPLTTYGGKDISGVNTSTAPKPAAQQNPEP